MDRSASYPICPAVFLGCVLWANTSPPNPECVWFFSFPFFFFFWLRSSAASKVCLAPTVLGFGLGWAGLDVSGFGLSQSASDVAAGRQAVPVGAGSVVGWLVG